MNPQPTRQLLRHPLGWIASGAGSGLFPVAPGTAGSALALLPAWFLLPLGPAWYGLALLLCFGLGCWASGWADRVLARHDPGCIVIDEWFGQWLTLAPLLFLSPVGPRWAWFALGFVLFRIADVLKPWPASWADEKVHGGFGVMLDDALAALYSMLVLALLAATL